MKGAKRVLKITLLVVILMTFMSSFVLADPINPGVKLGNWVQTNVAGLFVGGLAIIGLLLLVFRKLMLALMLLIFAGVAGAFIYSGSALAQKLQELILSWF